MKGVIFTEFLEMVEDQFSDDLANQIIEDCELPSGGSYTTLGTYGHGEMLSLAQALSARTGTPIPDLLRAFGRHLFGYFERQFPELVKVADNALEFLIRVDDYIHAEVRKLYPDAELPKFEFELPVPGTIVLLYSSKRPFAHLAEGLILGCLDYYNENFDVNFEDLSNGVGTDARITLTAAE